MPEYIRHPGSVFDEPYDEIWLVATENEGVVLYVCHSEREAKQWAKRTMGRATITRYTPDRGSFDHAVTLSSD